MHSFHSSLTRLFLACMLLATAQANADTSYIADFSTTTLDPGLVTGMWKGGDFSPGVVLPWIVSTGTGALVLAKTFTQPGNQYVDGPHVNSAATMSGDFIARTTVDSSYNGAGGGGFFMDSGYGYTGFSFGTNWLQDAAGDSFSSTGYFTSATPLVTLQIERHGDTLTKSYKLEGQSDFTVMSVLTAPGVAGWASFDMTDYGDDTAATAIQFTSFSVQAVPEPSGYAMLLGGLVLVGWLARRRRAA